MDEQQHRIRRSILVTASIGIVFWASDNADGIDWIIKLDGWQAWGFLLLAHLYYSIMWIFHRKIFIASQRAVNVDEADRMVGGRAADRYFLRLIDGVEARMYMARGFTDLIAILGGIIIVINFLYWLEQSQILSS